MDSAVIEQRRGRIFVTGPNEFYTPGWKVDSIPAISGWLMAGPSHPPQPDKSLARGGG